MQVSMNTGKHMRDKREANKAAVKAWFEANPGKSRHDCATALGLCYTTIAILVRLLKKEAA